MKNTPFVLMTICALMVACAPAKPPAESSEPTDQNPKVSTPTQDTMLISNIADDASEAQVRSALGQHLSHDQVNRVMSWIKDYNQTIQKVSLTDGFSPKQPDYDTLAMDTLWADAKGDFIGTNCRINTFALLKDTIHISEDPTKSDAQMLFPDHDAIEVGGLIDDTDLPKYNRLYGRVKTQATKDAKVHAKHMKSHFKGIEFNDQATMLSVVFHDDQDGEYLFIGHVGVLVPADDGYLFIEKLSFQDPYQAIKFTSKHDAYTYLLTKYATHYNQPTAQPFVMENDTLVKWVEE